LLDDDAWRRGEREPGASAAFLASGRLLCPGGSIAASVMSMRRGALRLRLRA
jgi:hypothetical protein